MGLQLSVLIGCVGAIEMMAILKHVAVCVLKVTEHPSNCCIEYFHRPQITDDFVIVEKPNLEDDENNHSCSEIEAILRQTKSEPDILCLGPPTIEGYVRVPTPIPFGIDDENADQKSNASSSADSGNDNPVTQKSNENLSVKHYNGSSSDVSSLEDTENIPRSTTKKVLRRSRTPEIHTGCYDDEVGKDKPQVKKTNHKTTLSSGKRSTRMKSKNTEIGKSAENLSTVSGVRKSKRHREPERCKSEIQLRNLKRDEWTNTSPVTSECNLSRTSSKKSISVFIQTSFEDKLRFPENNTFQSLDVPTCPNCVCNLSRVKRSTETDYQIDGKPQLVKISSFEEASGDDYAKLKTKINNNGRKNWTDKIKSSIESESFDEYQDAEEEGIPFCEQPIQYNIPDTGEDAFWVTRRSPSREDVRVSLSFVFLVVV